MQNLPQKVLTKVFQKLETKNPHAGLMLLNLVLPQVIPFNIPIGLKIKYLTKDKCIVSLPFKRGNKNHVGGMHACALATAGEYAAGLLLLKRIDLTKIRPILKNLNVEYMKQGLMHSRSEALWPANAPNIETLTDAVDISMTSTLRSNEGAELAKVHTLWQLKPWSQVKKKSSGEKNG